jgi:membrane carboxypeptidase/penicillin-binding protein
MKEALRGQPPEWFEPPEGIVSYWVDTTTGLRVKEPAGRPLATYYREYFRRGTEPPLQEPLPLWQVAPETLDYD